MISETEAAAAAMVRCEKLCQEAEKLEKEGKSLLAAENYLEGTIAGRYIWKQSRFCSFQKYEYTGIIKWHIAMGRVLTLEQRKTVRGKYCQGQE